MGFMKPYSLGHSHVVNSIEKKGSYYIVHGQNQKGNPHSIQVHFDGSIKDFQGKDKIDGYVAGQMKSQISNYQTPKGLLLNISLR